MTSPDDTTPNELDTNPAVDPPVEPPVEPFLPPPSPPTFPPPPSAGVPPSSPSVPPSSPSFPPPPPPFPPPAPPYAAPLPPREPVGPPPAPPPRVVEPPFVPQSSAAPGSTGPDEPSSPDVPVVVRTPRWVFPVVVLACVALFVGGALAGWAIASRDDDRSDTGATPVTQVNTGGDGGAAPVPSGVDEPVAAVARAVAPSVVQIETNFGLGSGIVLDTDGHILTAAHVVESAIEVRVRLPDGTVVAADIVGTSPETDVGVVKIAPRDDLRPATLAVGEPVQVGQLAVAVGSPFGLQQTVTSGIVSALDRPVETAPTFRVGMIQTDASINPGNSGGALADRHGRVIGINDAIRTQGGGNEGVGFAIPIELAASVAERLIAGEPIRSGFLGVTALDAVEGRPGAVVRDVAPDSPAAAAGIQPGDLIVSVDGQPVRGVTQLRARILAIQPGTEVVVEVVRGDETLAFDVVLATATQ